MGDDELGWCKKVILCCKRDQRDAAVILVMILSTGLLSYYFAPLKVPFLISHHHILLESGVELG